jgi:transposase
MVICYEKRVSQRLILSPPERRKLEERVRSRSARAEEVQRAKIILLLASGRSQWAVSRQLGCSINTVRLWLERFRAERLAGLFSRHRGKIASQQTAQLEAQILARVRQKPQDGSIHWSTRKLAAELGTNHTRVARVLARAGLQPHRLRRYLASQDPDFETKAADIIGLYLKPPVNAAVFCVDEKTAIQALDRHDPVLPLSPGRAERHGFEYYRHGTLSLYAALNTKTGQVLAQTAPRHTSAEFVAFLEQIVASIPEGRQIHIIADNLSAHRTSRVWQFIETHPQVRIHFTPTYASWLNQIEIWFSKIQRNVIARGIFHSVKDLAQKLMSYIRRYNKKAKPFKWTYRSAERRIKPISVLNATQH